MSNRTGFDIDLHSSAYKDDVVQNDQSASAPSGRASYSALDIFAAFVAVLIPIAYSPVVYTPSFSPKVAVSLILLGVGAPILVRVAVKSPYRVAARLSLAFLVIGLISALTSRAPLVGIFGHYEWSGSWIFFGVVMAAWAIGASLSVSGKRLLGSALIVGAGLNGVVALIQIIVHPSAAGLGLYSGTQADGLMGNPVHLEAILVAALAIVVVRAIQESKVWLLAVVCLAFALALTEERFAFIVLVAMVAFCIAKYRNRVAAIVSASLICGYGFGFVVTTIGENSRLATVANTANSPRISFWLAGIHGLFHHLLLGVGPGQFESSYLPYQTLSLARRLGPGVYAFDAHDIFLEIATTTGLLGAICFCAFLFVAARRSAGELVGFAVMALAVELIEPLNYGVTPLAFLALGAALPVASTTFSRYRPSYRIGQAVLIFASVSAAMAVVYGDFELGQGILHYDMAQVERGNKYLPFWSFSAVLTGQVAMYYASITFQNLRWREVEAHFQTEVVQREPTDPERWYELGLTELDMHLNRLAANDFHRAVILDPYNVHALSGLGVVAVAADNWSRAQYWYRKALAAGPHYPPATQGLMRATKHIH